MLDNELVSAWDFHITLTKSVGDDLPPTIRPNWGTVLVASLLGGSIEQVGDATPLRMPNLSSDSSEYPLIPHLLSLLSPSGPTPLGKVLAAL
jgi:hypothetical protein